VVVFGMNQLYGNLPYVARGRGRVHRIAHCQRFETSERIRGLTSPARLTERSRCAAFRAIR
jgi:hypothetical protein